MVQRVEGGCHCGLVRFEATLPDGPVEILDCDCSICSMTGYLHLIVPEKDFRLVEGRRDTTTYRYGSGTARHIFCTQCGARASTSRAATPTRSASTCDASTKGTASTRGSSASTGATIQAQLPSLSAPRYDLATPVAARGRRE